MNLIYRLNLLLLFFFCLPVLLAQSDFRPGYVITNENDTINGLIDYRGDTRNSKICVFKENATSASREYLPSQIKAYRFPESKYYVSRNVLEKGTENDLFLEFLVNGIADLYYYRDGNSSYYFIEKSDGQLFELSNDEVEIKKDGKTYLRQTKQYIGSLRYAFADCPQLFETINNATLETKSLMNITKKYHNYVCDSSKCIIYEKKVPGVKFTIAPFVSMNVSTLNIENGRYIYETIEFESSTYPSIGVLLNTSIPKASEKLSLQVSAEVGKIVFDGYGTYGGNSSSHEVHLQSTPLKGKIGLKYTYPTGRFRPMIVVGGHFAKLINSKGRRIETRNEGATVSEHNDNILAGMNYGYNVDLGIDYQNSTSFKPFISIGISSSTGRNTDAAYKIYTKNNFYPLWTKLKTFCFTAGFYF